MIKCRGIFKLAMPDRLCPNIPVTLTLLLLLLIHRVSGSLTQSIRNFAKGLESWLTSAMADCPEEMTQIKVR